MNNKNKINHMTLAFLMFSNMMTMEAKNESNIHIAELSTITFVASLCANSNVPIYQKKKIINKITNLLLINKNNHMDTQFDIQDDESINSNEPHPTEYNNSKLIQDKKNPS